MISTGLSRAGEERLRVGVSDLAVPRLRLLEDDLVLMVDSDAVDPGVRVDRDLLVDVLVGLGDVLVPS